jgi:IclR family pca regulon transcriptional regulator
MAGRASGKLPSKESVGSRNIVYSIEKAFRVLEAFNEREPEMILADVARRAGLDNATAFRMLNTLVLLGYVEKAADSRNFRLSLKCLDLGFNAIARSDLRTITEPILHQLVSGGAGAASVGVLDKGEVIYIERVQQSLTRLAVDIRIGTRIPAFCSAMGRAILAFLPEKVQRIEMRARPLEKLTPMTITDEAELRMRLKKVAEQGYAVVNQESVVGLIAIAAPIFGSDQLPIAAVSIAMPSSATSEKDFSQRFAEPILKASKRLSRAIKASGGVAGAL